MSCFDTDHADAPPSPRRRGFGLLAGVGAFAALFSSPAAAFAADEHAEHILPSLFWTIPFIALLLSIAILPLIPVLTSTGRGADIMAPMAIPTFGGMSVVLVSVFVVPVLYCAIEEFKSRLRDLKG